MPLKAVTMKQIMCSGSRHKLQVEKKKYKWAKGVGKREAV